MIYPVKPTNNKKHLHGNQALVNILKFHESLFLALILTKFNNQSRNTLAKTVYKLNFWLTKQMEIITENIRSCS